MTDTVSIILMRGVSQQPAVRHSCKPASPTRQEECLSEDDSRPQRLVSRSDEADQTSRLSSLLQVIREFFRPPTTDTLLPSLMHKAEAPWLRTRLGRKMKG